jgi:RNA polymerase sigma factor (sigma-70 family)
MSGSGTCGGILNVMQSDAQLLREYADRGSDWAFTELVRRHTDLVYSAAIRQAGSPDLAQDAAQRVFISLACKASSLVARMEGHASLAGWLYQSTRFETMNLMRGERRRVERETQSARESEAAGSDAPEWDRVSRVLDGAMAELNDSDRNILLMRFFKNLSYEAVGATLGLGANSAQQRVIRALERLRKTLVRHGVTTTSGALSIALQVEGIQAAPVGLSGILSASALLAKAALPTAAAGLATQTLAMTTVQKTIAVAVFAIAAATSVYEARQARNWRHQVGMLQQELMPLAGEIEQLRQERDAAKREMALAAAGQTNATDTQSEILRLRGEVGRLRNRTQELGKLLQARATSVGAGSSSPNPPGDPTGPTILSRESWTFAGLGTPEDALKSYMWAKSHGEVDLAFATATPELKEKITSQYFKDKSTEEISALLIESSKNQTAVHILNKLEAAEDQLVFQVHIDGTPDKSYSLLTMKKLDGEWRVSAVEERPGEP